MQGAKWLETFIANELQDLTCWTKRKPALGNSVEPYRDRFFKNGSGWRISCDNVPDGRVQLVEFLNTTKPVTVSVTDSACTLTAKFSKDAANVFRQTHGSDLSELKPGYLIQLLNMDIQLFANGDEKKRLTLFIRSLSLVGTGTLHSLRALHLTQIPRIQDALVALGVLRSQLEESEIPDAESPIASQDQGFAKTQPEFASQATPQTHLAPSKALERLKSKVLPPDHPISPRRNHRWYIGWTKPEYDENSTDPGEQLMAALQRNQLNQGEPQTGAVSARWAEQDRMFTDTLSDSDSSSSDQSELKARTLPPLDGFWSFGQLAVARQPPDISQQKVLSLESSWQFPKSGDSLQTLNLPYVLLQSINLQLRPPIGLPSDCHPTSPHRSPTSSSESDDGTPFTDSWYPTPQRKPRDAEPRDSSASADASPSSGRPKRIELNKPLTATPRPNWTNSPVIETTSPVAPDQVSQISQTQINPHSSPVKSSAARTTPSSGTLSGSPKSEPAQRSTKPGELDPISKRFLASSPGLSPEHKRPRFSPSHRGARLTAVLAASRKSQDVFHGKKLGDNTNVGVPSSLSANDPFQPRSTNEANLEPVTPIAIGSVSGLSPRSSVNHSTISLKTAASSDRDLDSAKAALFNRFKAAYGTYNGDESHFFGRCRALLKLQERKSLDSLFWDDFIIRHRVDYIPYVTNCAEQGEDAMPYEEYFQTLREGPPFGHRQIVSGDSLQMALRGTSSQQDRMSPQQWQPTTAADPQCLPPFAALGSDEEQVQSAVICEDHTFSSVEKIVEPFPWDDVGEIPVAKSAISIVEAQDEDMGESDETRIKQFTKQYASLKAVEGALGTPDSSGLLKKERGPLSVLAWKV